MQSEQDAPRVLTATERGVAVGLGIAMLMLSLLALGVMIALAMPMVRLVEGLSK
jgi:hypothetical protein